MKTVRFSFILVLVWLLMGCGVEGETATAVSTALSTAVPTHVAVAANTAVPASTQPPVTEMPMVMDTAVASPTDTATSLPAKAVSTALSTAVPTETPTITPTSPPSPPGEVYFFLDPDPPSPDNESFDPRTYNFYRAIPGATTDEWEVETIWEETTLTGQSVFVSPDKTMLALLLIEDTNGDGQLNDDPGEDVRNIYIYDRSASSTYQLTNNQYNSFSASWLPDGQSITYSQRSDILNVTLTNPLPERLLTVPESSVWQLSWSPDGQLLAFHTNTQQLYAYHPDTDERELVSDSEAALDFIGSVWSPDGHWLAYMQFANYALESTRRLYVMDRETLTPMWLNSNGDVVSRPVWSTDSSFLAFTRNETTLSLWSTETLTFTNVLSVQHTSPPVWSPIVPQVAVGIMQDGVAQLITVDARTGNIQTVFENTKIEIIKPLSWSPNGEWVLFFVRGNNESSLNVIHTLSGAFYQVADISGSDLPLELIWLPDLQHTSN